MDNERILKLILSVAGERDGRKTLDCADAFKLSAQHDLRLDDIARVCNLNRVKITHCQLGCFT